MANSRHALPTEGAPVAGGSQTIGVHFSTNSFRSTSVVFAESIGDLRRLALLIGRPGPHFVISDAVIASLYGGPVLDAIQADLGTDIHLLSVPVGESAKTLSNVSRTIVRLLECGAKPDSVVISLGGGSVANLAGFVAATLYRGVDLLHIPTTLLSQCDAAIGSKQAVNVGDMKNAMGAHYAPLAVVIVLEFLKTLPPRAVSHGMAEVIKHALAEGGRLLEFLMTIHDAKAMTTDLATIVDWTVRQKCALINADPTERGPAAVLQYGHAFAHALEEASAYDIAHGDAVAVGMMASAHLAVRCGISDRALVGVHEDLLTRFNLPTTLSSMNLRKAADLLSRGRMSRRSRLYLPLLTEVGILACSDEGSIVSVDVDVAAAALEACRADR